MAKRHLADKRVLITGASSGVGRQLALHLAREGAAVILFARRHEKLLELADEIQRQESPGHGADSIVVVAGDVTSEADRGQALTEAENRWGGLDILVNNAGITAHGRFADASPEALRQIMEVNFFAAVDLTRVALPLLAQGDDAAVVNIGSILGRRGIPFNSEYCASKFALAGWSEAVRPELHRQGVELLLVTPGTIETDFFDHSIEKTSELPWSSQRGITPEHVARKTLHALERRRHEITLNTRGKLLLALNRLAPRLVDRMLRKYG